MMRLRRLLPLFSASLLAGLTILLVSEATGPGGAQPADASAARGEGKGLVLREIAVSGQRHGDATRIDAILDGLRGQPVAKIDLAAARSDLLALPWIAAATLKLELPDRLDVALREHEAAAVWQHDGRSYLVNRKGHVLMPDPPRRWYDLPRLVGEGAATAAEALLRALDDRPDLKARLQSATHIANRRWTLRLTSGIDVALPEEGWPDESYGLSDALDRLAELDTRFGTEARAISRIDLRFSDRIILRRLPGTDIADTALEHST